MTGKPVEVREEHLREPEEPKVEEKELEEEARERRETASAELAKALSRVIGESGKITIKIERLTTSLPAVEKALSPRRATDAREIAESDDGESVKKANDKAVEDTLKNAAADEAEPDADGEEEKEKKESNLKTYLAGFLALAMGGGELYELLLEALTRGANGDKIDDLVTSRADQEALLDLLKKLADEPDDKYWADFADFVVRRKASLAEIVFFLQYTMLLNPLGKSDPFVWESWSDENEQVEALIAVYKNGAASGKTDVIKALPKVKYQDAEVPRYIQASLGQLAFGRALQDRKG
jgi:hypothetical protein